MTTWRTSSSRPISRVGRIAVIAIALVLGGLVATAPAARASASPVTAAFLHGEVGSYVFAGQASYTTVTASVYGTNGLQITMGGTYTLTLRNANDGPFAVGDYQIAGLIGQHLDQPTADLDGAGRGCGSAATGRFLIDQLSWSGTTVTALAVRFEFHCEGGDPAVFGTGDCIALASRPDLLKNGVYAVRQGGVLFGNVASFLREKPLTPFRPQRFIICAPHRSQI